MNRLALLALSLAACEAQYGVQPGPTFGGDLRSGGIVEALRSGVMPDAETVSAAGIFSALPLAIGQYPCDSVLCLETRSTWLPSDELLVGLSIDGTRERPPVDMAFALDASGSVLGSEDVRAATVEVALERLGEDDSLGVWAFTGVAEPLVPTAPVNDWQRTEVRTALDALDGLPAAMAATPEPCMSWDDVVALYDADGEDMDATEDTASPQPQDTAAPEASDADFGPLFDWVDDVRQSANEDLGPALMALGCTSGSAVVDGVMDAVDSLPDGSETRASRLVLVSDLQGELPTEAVETAAARGVGTSVLGVTASTDRIAMAAIASAPGAHMLDAVEPSAALESWEARFDAWVAPTSWGLAIELSEWSSSHWTLVRRVGTTDLEGLGANTVFASRSHGMLALVLEPKVEDPDPPVFIATSTRLDGEHTLATWSQVPVRLVGDNWGEGEDVVAIQLAWRLALVDAIADQDQTTWQALLER